MGVRLFASRRIAIPPAFSDQSLAHIEAVGFNTRTVRSSFLDRLDARCLFCAAVSDTRVSSERTAKQQDCVLQGVAQMVMNMEEPVCSLLRRRPPPLSPGVFRESVSCLPRVVRQIAWKSLRVNSATAFTEQVKRRWLNPNRAGELTVAHIVCHAMMGKRSERLKTMLCRNVLCYGTDSQ